MASSALNLHETGYAGSNQPPSPRGVPFTGPSSFLPPLPTNIPQGPPNPSFQTLGRARIVPIPLTYDIARLHEIAIANLQSTQPRSATDILAAHIASSREGEGLPVEYIPAYAQNLLDQGIIVNSNGRMTFGHPFFFEHCLMSFWSQKWERAFREGQTHTFWSELGSHLKFEGTERILGKWCSSDPRILKDLSQQPSLHQLSYFESLLCDALAHHRDPLLNKLLSKRQLNLDTILMDSCYYTYALHAIKYQNAAGLRTLINRGASYFHPQFLKKCPGSSNSPERVSNREGESESDEDCTASHNKEKTNSPSTSESDEGCIDSDTDIPSDSERITPSTPWWEDGITSFISNPKKHYWGPHETEVASDLYWHQATLQDDLGCLCVLLEAYKIKQETQQHNISYNEAFKLHIKEYDNDGQSCLHIAVLKQRYAAAALLIQANLHINEGDAWKETPLHNAVYKGDVAMAEILLKANADPNKTSAQGLTPLHLAIACLDFRMLQLLVSYKGKFKSIEWKRDSYSIINVSMLLDYLGKNKPHETKKFIADLVYWLSALAREMVDPNSIREMEDFIRDIEEVRANIDARLQQIPS